MLFLNRQDVEQALPLPEAITAMKIGFSALSSGKAEIPLRTKISVGGKDAVVLFMPAFLDHDRQKSISLKAVAVFPENVTLDLPIIHAAVLVMDVNTGQINAVMEGSSLTAIRTGGASGAATEILSREECRVGAIFGAGVQGRTQLQAVCSVRSLEKVWIYDPREGEAVKFREELAGQGPIPEDLRVAETPAQALSDVDIICAATTSREPIFQAEDIKPGTHINGVGSYTPQMKEIPPQLIQKASMFVGSTEAVLAEAGEVIEAEKQGWIDRAGIVELGSVINQQASGRREEGEITFFKSVGVAVQDAAAAHLVLENARKMGLGKELDW